MRPEAAAGAREARGRVCHCPADGPRRPPPPRGPERLYLPISKRQEYLQSSGEKVLASFPVQATIHFYNDDSDSEDGEQEEEEARPSDLQCREAGGPEDNGAGGPGGGWLTHPAQAFGGQGGGDGKGLLPGRHSPESALCSSSK